MEQKPLWQSKTVVVNAIVALLGVIASLGFVPSVHAWAQENVSVIAMVLGAVGVGLRLITKGKVTIFE